MFLQVSHITKSYRHEEVLHGVSLSVERGKTLAILGRSGSGKTTLLKILAGLEHPDGGEAYLDGRPLFGLPPQRRRTVYLYQEPLLFPHLNVFENVAFGLRLKRVSNDEVTAGVRSLLAELELSDHADKQPGQLSGGQRQRVAFGRAIIVRPALLLLDEPFGALDVDVRMAMQSLFRRLSARFEMTTLFVTHDVKEALTVGDSVARLAAGRLHQYDSVAQFVNDPSSGAAREIAFWSSLPSSDSLGSHADS